MLGGGLSGLAVATLLAERGVRVEIRDRRAMSGGRFEGGFQVLENGSRPQDVLAELDVLGFGRPPEVVPLTSAVLLDSELRRWEVSSREPYAYLVRRGGGRASLDGWLEDRAKSAGVRIRRGVSGHAVPPDVVATGPRRADGAAREVVFRTDHADLIAVLFDPALTPTGYAYLFVHDGWGTIGAARVRGLTRLRESARSAFARLDEAFPMAREVVGEKVLFMNFGLPSHLRSGATWYVGEAAGVQEFLFGLGNRLALRSAALVARAVAGDGFDADGFRRDLVVPMTASIAARAAYERLGPRLVRFGCRWLAAGDFRQRLIRLQSPTVPHQAVARMVMMAWRERRGCPHLPVARWCRRVEEG